MSTSSSTGSADLHLRPLELPTTAATPPSTTTSKPNAARLAVIFNHQLSTKIASFLPLNDIAAMRKSHREWRALDYYGGDRLDLSRFKKLSDYNINGIIEGLKVKASSIKFMTLPKGSPITDNSLKYLVDTFPHLISLNLSGCEEITNKGLSHLSKLPLTSLNLSEFYKITDRGLSDLSTCPLTTLNLSGCDKITDRGLSRLSTRPLTSLNLAWCDAITDKGISHLSTRPLTSLNLRGCDKITDRGLSHLSTRPLTSLDLSLCSYITDKGISHLSTCPLTALTLQGCVAIEDTGLFHLSTCPLTLLAIYHCDAITSGGKEAFLAGLIPKAELAELTDYYIYLLAPAPKGGDHWGTLNRCKDLTRLRLAIAIASEQSKSGALSFEHSSISKALKVIEIIDKKPKNKRSKREIDSLIAEMSDEMRNSIHYQVYSLAPEPKGGEGWGEKHRHEDPSRLRLAVIESLKLVLFRTHPLMKRALTILG